MNNNAMLMNADERYVKAMEIINAHGGYTASLVENQKCNGAKLGMMIRKKGSEIAPVFALPSLTEEVCAEKIAEYLLNEMETNLVTDTDMGAVAERLLGSFEAAKKFIFPRVCKSKENDEYLRGVVQDSFHDLSVYYIVSLELECSEISGRVRITEELLKQWKVDKEAVRLAAEHNAAQSIVYSNGNMRDLSCSKSGSIGVPLFAFSEDEVSPGGMYVLTYKNCIGGGAIICRQELLKSIADKAGCDLIIIPSSVEEIIVLPLPDIRYGDICYFNGMVQDVNQCVLDADIILSDHVYVFSREEGRILDQLEVIQKY